MMKGRGDPSGQGLKPNHQNKGRPFIEPSRYKRDLQRYSASIRVGEGGEGQCRMQN